MRSLGVAYRRTSDTDLIDPRETGMAYWLNLFTLETWHEFKQHGGTVSGFRASRWNQTQKIEPGDHLLCYMVRAYRWVAVLEVTGAPYFDDDQAHTIWSQDTFPARVPVKILLEVPPDHGVAVVHMLDELEVTAAPSVRGSWGMAFRGSPSRWTEADGDLVTEAIKQALIKPLFTELPKRAYTKSTVVETDDGVITVPRDDEELDEESLATGTEHTHMQYLLGWLGSAMGYNVFIPAADRGK